MVQLAQTVVFGFLVLFFVYRIISPPRDASEIKPPSASPAPSAPPARGLKAFEPIEAMPAQRSFDDFIDEPDFPEEHVPV